jgi:tetratricopeptide (TPR) repeat protein
LKEAVRLVPEDFLPRLNYGIVLLNQKKFPEAEEQLRVATSKNSNAATAHMYFGIVLAVQRKLDEGQKELQLAIASNSPDIALAHRYLAGVYLERQSYKQAADELQKYLELVPKAPDAEVLHRKIKELRNKK